MGVARGVDLEDAVVLVELEAERLLERQLDGLGRLRMSRGGVRRW